MQDVLPSEPGLERESVSWFARIWPRTQRPCWPSHRPLNAVQRAGDVIFVPAGWWHAVLNLDVSVAVTHNFCSSANFDRVWRHTLRGRPKLSVKWLEALRQVWHRYRSAMRAPIAVHSISRAWSLGWLASRHCSIIMAHPACVWSPHSCWGSLFLTPLLSECNCPPSGLSCLRPRDFASCEHGQDVADT
jgi:JmjC domain, hydroxylase